MKDGKMERCICILYRHMHRWINAIMKLKRINDNEKKYIKWKENRWKDLYKKSDEKINKWKMYGGKNG